MPGSTGKDIKLSALLKENTIQLSLTEKNKGKLLSLLVELVARSGKIKDKKAYLRAILEREKLGSTGIGNSVAIPHAKSKAVKGMAVAFARCQEGVDFGALDGEKVHLFFMLASPESMIGEHLKVLARLSYLIKDKFSLDLLRKAQDKKEILKIISSHEKVTRD
ncbi:MAG: PTS sugar transporter subunit IIA [Candidatus Omnitrophica bacterium]|nr:PTS sugar transporter subunit IIA [Candidatus Omnitrophota bacterium]